MVYFGLTRAEARRYYDTTTDKKALVEAIKSYYNKQARLGVMYD